MSEMPLQEVSVSPKVRIMCVNNHRKHGQCDTSKGSYLPILKDHYKLSVKSMAPESLHKQQE